MTILALMGALMFALQVAMASLPNIHPVAALIIATTLVYRWRSLYSVGVFILLEGLMYGFGLWWFCYFYLWPLLVVLTMLLRRNEAPLFWAAAAGLYGLCFGALCSVPYLWIGGWTLAFSYWVSGIPFDLLHCGGNFVMTLVLLRPVTGVMRRFGPLGASPEKSVSGPKELP